MFFLALPFENENTGIVVISAMKRLCLRDQTIPTALAAPSLVNYLYFSRAPCYYAIGRSMRKVLAPLLNTGTYGAPTQTTNPRGVARAELNT